MRTVPGADKFISSREHWPKPSQKVFFAGNQSSFDSSYRPTLDLLLARGMKIDCIIAPEHGLYGYFQDMETFADNRHPYFDIPVISIYGRDESSLDINGRHIFENSFIIYDIQDVGSRYYTFLWSLYRLLRAFSGTGSQLAVLDRPNPIMPLEISGPRIYPGFESFVGEFSIPVIYGLTAGEFALYIKDRLKLDIDIKIIEMESYERSMFYDQTGLPWGFPSPNMPCLETALLYPGGCLLEGTNISEGRGTTRPFSVMGAPFIEPERLCRELSLLENPGVLYKPIYFRPMFSKYQGTVCGGIEIAVCDREIIRPLEFFLNIISVVIMLYPDSFAWRKERYEYREDIMAIDMLTGSEKTRKYLDKGEKAVNITAEWAEYENEYRKDIQNYLIYR